MQFATSPHVSARRQRNHALLDSQRGMAIEESLRVRSRKISGSPFAEDQKQKSCKGIQGEC